MKKKLLALLLATSMSMALIACGGSKEAATEETAVEEEVTADEVAEEVAGDYTDEQAAFVDTFNTMVDDYNVIVDAVNAREDLTENQELVDLMNEITACIDEASEIISDPANLTEEVMDVYRDGAFVETYKFMDSIKELLGEDVEAEVSEGKAAMRSVFTTAVAGTDEAENTYFFLFNDDVTFGAFVILSADESQSVNVVGNITEGENGALVVTDEATSSYIAFTVVEEAEDYLVVSVEEGNEVTLVGWDLDEAIDVVLAIDEVTEIVQ